jgi:shikimate dehydrogenase
MRLYLLGRGIQRSLSPAMWNGVFDRLGFPARYGLLDLGEGGLDAAFADLFAPDVLGYNVTMPYQGWAYEHAARRSRDVERARSCTWIYRRDGRISAENSDVAAARALLGVIPQAEHVLLLGAGGTAAAMLTALQGRADRVVVSNRTHERAVALVERAAAWLGSGSAVPWVSAVPWEKRMAEAVGAELIINTTPLGARDDCSPLDDMEPSDGTCIYDVVYRARPTPLQRQAARWGLPLADGLAHLEAHAVAMLPYVGLRAEHAELVRSSLSAAVGHPPCRWRVPSY